MDVFDFFERFVYRWTATVPGTNWYHSHIAHQRGDGLLGMYVVRLPPEEESHARRYDYDLTDHHMIAQEWFHGVNYIFITKLSIVIVKSFIMMKNKKRSL